MALVNRLSKPRIPSPKWLKAALIGLLCQSACLPEARPLQADYFPPSEAEGGWRKRTDPSFVSSLGLDPQRLEEFGGYNLSVPNSNWKPYADYQGTIVIKNGWIVGEWYNVPEARTFQTYLSSNGKSVAAMCFGILAEDGAAGRIPHRIEAASRVYDRRWLPQGFPLSDPLKADITFEQIFQHTSGLCAERTGTGAALETGRNEWTDYESWVLGRDARWPSTGKIYFPPGEAEGWMEKEVWGDHAGGYSTIGFAHFGLILRNVYGIPAREFLWKRLLEPIGFSGIDFHAPPSQEVRWVSSGGLRMTPRDYARFAYLLLRDGRWRSGQVVGTEWVRKFRESTAYANIRSNQDGFFGPYPADMFRIAGSGLNWAFMIPSLDLIALRTGRADNRRWDEVEQQFLQKLFAAVQGEPAVPPPGPSRLVADPRRPAWLWRSDGRPFFMAGPGDPEGFLYRGTLLEDGTREGDQMELISKMKGTGANCIYLMAIRSHGGDGGPAENPFAGHDPAAGLNEKILDQWERWFTVMDRQRITIFFFFFDDGARLAPRRSPLNDAERSLIRRLVRRFQHHRNLVWCLAEEYQEGFTPAQALEFAAEIRAVDGYRHPIAVHKLSGTDFAEFAESPDIDQFALQLGKAENPEALVDPQQIHRLVLEAWDKAAGRYSLNMSELAGHYVPGNRLLTRQKSWASAMAGAYVMIINMDIESTDREALQDAGHMVRFFESTDFYRMRPRDELAEADTRYVLASEENSYILYSPGPARRLGLRAAKPGSYRLRWLECGSGREVVEENVSISAGASGWEVPPGLSGDIALYVGAQ